MNAAYRSVAVAGIMAVVFMGCTAVTGRTAGQYFDDKMTHGRVKTQLALDNAAALTRVNVDVYNGTVYLNGVVRNEEQKRRLELLAAEAGRPVVNNVQVLGTMAAQRGELHAAPVAQTDTTPPRDVAASPAMVSAADRHHALTGEVTSVDAASGRVSVRTGDTTYDFHLPRSALHNVRPGDRVAIDVSVQPAPGR